MSIMVLIRSVDRPGPTPQSRKAAMSIVTGSWRNSAHLSSFSGAHVTLTRRDKRRGHITFDGEVERKAGPLVYDVQPGAIQVIAARR